MRSRRPSVSRVPRSGNAALAAGAVVQAAIGAEFVLAGLSKAVDPNYVAQFRSFVQSGPGSTSGLLAPIIQSVVLPNADLVGQLAKFIELFAGGVLIVTAIEVARRRLSGPLGAQHAYEPLAALLSSLAAFALGGMSLSIFLVEGGRLPSVNPAFAFVSPIAVELLLVPLAFAIGWLEFGRYRAVRAAMRQ
jgi:hypothetical protein